MTTLRQLGELEIIRRLAAGLTTRPGVVVGIGDDAAVVRADDSAFDLLLTTDAVIEGTHFNAGTDPAQVGHKAIARALSDIAAMGGEAQFLLVDLVARGETDISVVEQIYAGAAKIAATHGVAIVGGDTARGAALELHVFAMGRVPKGTALLRSAAQPGDAIYVTGTLGGSLAGRHLVFEPRLNEGQWLRAQGWARALIDVSDGLATDLQHIAEASGVGAVLQEERIPASPEAMSMNDGRSPVEHALLDGEDFELLFTVPESKVGAFERAWSGMWKLPCTKIGAITNRMGELLLRDIQNRERPLTARGFEHFKAGANGEPTKVD